MLLSALFACGWYGSVYAILILRELHKSLTSWLLKYDALSAVIYRGRVNVLIFSSMIEIVVSVFTVFTTLAIMKCEKVSTATKASEN